MKQYSYFLFPFVFWVITILMVIIRFYIWDIFYKSLVNNRTIRFEGVLLEKQYTNINKYYIWYHGVRVGLGDFHPEKPEGLERIQYQPVRVSGILQRQLPDVSETRFVLRDAEIVLSGTRELDLTTSVSSFLSWSQRLRTYADDVLGRYFSSDHRWLVSGMLLGSGGQVNREAVEIFRGSGILHLVAASGYNVTMVISFIYLFTLFVINKYLKIFIVTLLVFVYSSLAGFEASIVRAGITGLVAYAALSVTGSSQASKRLFIFVILLMLWVRPWWLWDIGFQLSAAATTGILWLGPHLRRISSRELRASISASIATTPIMAAHFGFFALSFTGPLLTALVQPLVPVIMTTGLATILFAAVTPWLGWIPASVGMPAVWAVFALARVAATMNHRLLTYL